MSHERPAIPSADELANLPRDGGEGWNRLVFEQSPYLLQHAANPVDWWPWGDAAFEEARRRDVPVFLSIGYSTCHWCHVMERESFEDGEVATLMNEAFVCIKVDREERPDVDQVYMTVTQALTQQGGWPMTVILTPDRRPFFAGTYFPKRGAWGRTGMMELVPAVAEAWRERREELLDSAEQIVAAIQPLSLGTPGARPGEGALRKALAFFADHFDAQHGGFEGGRTKFPTPHNLALLLRIHRRTQEPQAMWMVEKTLGEMRLGGIFDHVGFGFHRYSTDRRWLLPHFEKMLYDQAMLLIAYAEAFQATGKAEYRRTAEEIAEYVRRDLSSPQGAFLCAEDADSEGVEGKFYVWSVDEALEVLGEEDGKLYAKVYNFERDGNFMEEATGHATGENIPHLRRRLADQIEQLGLDVEATLPRVEAARLKLFAHREKRVRPYRDDKVLTDWNGLMIAAFAKAAKAFGDARFSDAAAKAAEFVFANLATTSPDGAPRLMKRWRNGVAGLDAHLEDYAFMAWGLLELYEATFDARHLARAVALADGMVARFGDAERGGFFSTAVDAEALIVRAKDAYDGAIPSGNSAAAWVLARLARATGRPEYELAAWRTIEAFGAALAAAPHAHCQMMAAVDFLLGPSVEIVVAGSLDDPATKAMIAAARAAWAPTAVLLHRPAVDDAPILRLAPAIAGQRAIGGKATGYVCRNFACELPVHDAETLRERLGAR